jgi:hypothetical protein
LETVGFQHSGKGGLMQGENGLRTAPRSIKKPHAAQATTKIEICAYCACQGWDDLFYCESSLESLRVIPTRDQSSFGEACRLSDLRGALQLENLSKFINHSKNETPPLRESVNHL